MKDCDNSTRKIRISNNFILSISLLIMFHTLLLRPSLHCNTPLHFTTLHPTTLHYTSLHFTPHRSTLLSLHALNKADTCRHHLLWSMILICHSSCCYIMLYIMLVCYCEMIPHGFEFNPLRPELNPICYLLALLAFDFLHVSRIRVNAPQSVGLLWTSDQLVAETSTWQQTTLTTDKYLCTRWDSNPRFQ
jgi:hypothetical protein